MLETYRKKNKIRRVLSKKMDLPGLKHISMTCKPFVLAARPLGQGIEKMGEGEFWCSQHTEKP